MSVSEFSAVLRSRVTKSIKQKISRKNSALKGFIGAETDKVKALRTRVQSAKYNNIVITKQGFDKLAKELAGAGNTSYNTYIKYMMYRRNNNSMPKSLDELEEVSSINSASSSNPATKDPWTIIYNTPYDNLFKWTEEYLKLSNVPQETIKLVLGKFDAGHTLGILTFRSMVSFGSQVDLDQKGKIVIREQDPDLAFFDRLNQLLLDLDLAATNSIRTDTGIYTKAVKDFKEGAQFYIEMQIKNNESGTGNQQTGQMVADLSKAMAKFAKATAAQNKNLKSEFDGILANIQKLDKQARQVLEQYPEEMKKAAIENLDLLLKSKGSRSYVEHVEDTIVDTIKGKKPKKETVKYPEMNIGNLEDPFKLLKQEVSLLIKEVRKVTKETQATLKKRASIKLRTNQGRFTSPIGIQNLINAKLHDQIKRNMGSPALNYQTGRFAHSAKVTNISVGRQGMLTAFYTYMKYPYQTFEPGFRQGSASRDPRLLIGKSIREIATEIVGNKLRTVRV